MPSVSRVLGTMLGALASSAAAVPAAAQAVSFTAPAIHAVGDQPVAAAVADVNGDADLDLLIVNRQSHDVSILLGGPGASFGTATSVGVGGILPTDLAIGTFDADADPDLAVVNAGTATNDATDRISILLGGIGGSFAAPATFSVGHQTNAIESADFNADGDPDLVTGHDGNNVLFIHLGGADATFSSAEGPTVGTRPNSIVIGQFNGDADPDIATANAVSNNVSVVLGETGGTFGAATNYPLPGVLNPGQGPLGLGVADLNGDGDPDLVTANRDVGALLQGGSGGTFAAAGTLSYGDTDHSQLAVGDFDNDGDPDLAVPLVSTAEAEGVAILRGGTGMTFGAPERFRAPGGPVWATPGDFNADGDLDLAIVGGLSDTVSVLLNRAHAPAAPTPQASAPASPANDNAPRVSGGAPGGTLVRLYTTTDCSGTPAATGTATEFASPGLTVAVPDDTTTTFRATATNAADVPSDCSSAAVTYVEHSSPPVARVVVSPTPVLTGRQVQFDASTSSGFGIGRHEWDLDGDGTFERDTGAVSTATRTYGGAAELNPGVRVSNDLGSSVARVPLSVRLAPPAGEVGISVRDTATGSLRYTNDENVTLTVVWPPLATTMLISNDGGFAGATTRLVATSTSWTLDVSGEERLPKTVYVRFQGSEVPTTSTFTDDIILDKRPPSVTQASLPAGGSASAVAARKRTYRVRVRARDSLSGVARVQVGGAPGRTLRAVKLGRVTRTLARTISVRATFRPRRVRAQDAAGNWSRWKTVTRTRR